MAKPVFEHRGRCDSDRVESYTARNPAGVELAITRCADCAAELVVPTGRAGSDVGPAMLPGSGEEPVGPEDALGPGPKRGDYSGRLGGANSHESGRSQNHRAGDVGEVPGHKGGVTTTAGGE